MSGASGGFTWRPTSPELLEEAETHVLSRVKSPYKGRFVNIGPVVGPDDCKIWTVSLNESCKDDKIPLVLLHGLGAGVGFWALSIDTLAASGRPLYIIDNLGFARSSRPVFSPDPAETEQQFVAAFEEWRKRMGLKKFVLLGHSMGGFIATSYSLLYPERIAHLILADPWGFTARPRNDQVHRVPVPLWIKVLAYLTRPFNPFWIVRTIGPLGPIMMKMIQAPLINKYRMLNDGETEKEQDRVDFGMYSYHCNAQYPSGENAFHTMSDFVWAQVPMLKRIPGQLSPQVDLTVMYGSRSFIWRISEEKFQEMRQGPSHTKIQILEGAGHDVYLDKRDEFNAIVLEACLMADEKFRSKK